MVKMIKSLLSKLSCKCVFYYRVNKEGSIEGVEHDPCKYLIPIYGEICIYRDTKDFLFVFLQSWFHGIILGLPIAALIM